MLIPRYWRRADSQATTPDGRRIHFHVWRGSRSSEGEAATLAEEAIGRIAARIAAGEGFPERYSYGDRPLREEVEREFPAADGGDAPEAAITRNSYGALVLNAARVFFIDVDVPRAEKPVAVSSSSSSSLWSLIEGVLGRERIDALPGVLLSLLESVLGPRGSVAPAAPSASADSASPALDRLRRWISSHPDWRVRVYRTHSGLRYLVTHALFTPTDAAAQEAMTALGADPQYVRLCRAQKSFRARLTPKPWRVGVENPPVRFPFESPGDERAMREWEARYDRASQGYASCRLLEELGGGGEHPEVAPLRALHDERTRAGSSLPLA
ncbi:MAG: hypothetical protein JO040_02425 [Gemmatimonadetes bacterium]|nr:hypothetical protein [Gemmatimonadota bacterium]